MVIVLIIILFFYHLNLWQLCYYLDQLSTFKDPYVGVSFVYTFRLLTEIKIGYNKRLDNKHHFSLQPASFNNNVKAALVILPDVTVFYC